MTALKQVHLRYPEEKMTLTFGKYQAPCPPLLSAASVAR